MEIDFDAGLNLRKTGFNRYLGQEGYGWIKYSSENHLMVTSRDRDLTNSYTINLKNIWRLVHRPLESMYN